MKGRSGQTIRLLLTCVKPPPAVYEGLPAEFGLQDRTEALLPGRSLPDGALLFDFEIQVTQRADGSLNPGGAYVHGPAQGRFLYLSWRSPGSAWIRRTKIPLADITPDLADAANGAALAATVAGDRAATAPLIDPWHVEQP